MTKLKKTNLSRPVRLVTAAAFLALAFQQQTIAQNVFVSPHNGKFIAARTSEDEIGFENGASSLWKHEQLPLSITCADEGTLTLGGEFSNPAGNFKVNSDGESIDFIGGYNTDAYMCVSLPKGYRITGYNIVMQNDHNSGGIYTKYDYGNLGYTAMQKTFYETGRDFNTSKPLATATKKGTSTTTMAGRDETGTANEYIIHRQSTGPNDMGNRIFFVLKPGSLGYYGVTIKSFEISFAADAPFTETFNPATNGSVSYTETPFDINKLDIGVISMQTKNSKTYYAYNYNNITDMKAYVSLFQQDAVRNGKACDSALTKNITTQAADGEAYFGLKNDIYYVESPTTVKNSNGLDMPVGYRVTGAKLKCTFAKGEYTGFGIVSTSDRYMGADLKFGSKPVLWQVEGDPEKGYIVKSGNKYLYQTDTYKHTLGITTDSEQATRFEINDDKQIRFQDYLDFGTITQETVESLGQQDTDGTWYILADDGKTKLHVGDRYKKRNGEALYICETEMGDGVLSDDNSLRVAHLFETKASTPGEFKVNIFSPDGKTIATTADINAENPTQEISVEGYNNDALKFQIEGLVHNDAQALVQISLTMEALNPYINSMKLVCHDVNSQKTVSQDFTTNNFFVRGGKFIFNTPNGTADDAWFSFENLQSQYCDNSYYDGKGNGKSRFNFVGSQYWDEDGGGAKLYGDNYNPGADYTRKVYVDVAGTEKFKFSNIDLLTNDITDTKERYLEEYPFTIEKYMNPEVGTPGKFEKFQLKNNENRIAYLFVADEPKYNISPATATEHRFYAFYQMNITLEQKTYGSKVAFKKIYDSTLYEGDRETAKWGVEVTTTELTKHDGEEIPEYGYLTSDQVMDAIDNAVAQGGNDVPENANDILYADMSKLSQVIFPSNMTHSSFETMRARLAKNSLLYLPYGTYGNCDNSASITRKGASTFHSCGNIVITDKQPFYAPFDIAVDAEQYATYKRSITAPENGKVNTASIILPFQISVDADGKHTNDNTQGRAGDGMSFTVNTLNAQNCLGYPADNSGKPSDVETGVAYFSPYTSSTNKTQANAPYLVKTGNVSSMPNTSFTVTEYGANVNATTQATDGKYSGSTAKGKLNRATYDLTPYGTYAGAKLAKTGNYFYYAAQKFLCSQNLSPRFDNVYVMPFRAYFEYTRRGYGSRPNELAVAFGENPEITGTDDINANGYGNAISVATGTGEISVTAHRDVQVAVNATDGMTLSKFGMNAGETKTIRLVPGIYIVNGEKVAVKQQ